MRGSGGTARCLSAPQAADRLGVDPAAVRAFVRMRLLRAASSDPLRVLVTDVNRLHRLLEGRVAGNAA